MSKSDLLLRVIAKEDAASIKSNSRFNKTFGWVSSNKVGSRKTEET